MAPLLNKMRSVAPALATLFAGACIASACGGAVSQTRLADPATLLAERDEWRGARTGPVVLRLHIEALVDTRPDPSKATSALVVHLVAAHYGTPAPIPVSFPVPRGARLAGSELRFVATGNTPTSLATPPRFTPCALDNAAEAATGCIDPDQDIVALTLPAPPDGGLVEAILRFDVAGTLLSDARFMGLVGLPVGELLLRYDLATDTVGTFQTTQPNARPIVTDKDGRRLIALLATNLAPVIPSAIAPFARYVTVRASPKGYDQTFAADWTVTTAAYRAGVVDASKALAGGYEVPYRPVGSGRSQVLDALAGCADGRCEAPRRSAGTRPMRCRRRSRETTSRPSTAPISCTGSCAKPASRTCSSWPAAARAPRSTRPFRWPACSTRPSST